MTMTEGIPFPDSDKYYIPLCEQTAGMDENEVIGSYMYMCGGELVPDSPEKTKCRECGHIADKKV